VTIEAINANITVLSRRIRFAAREGRCTKDLERRRDLWIAMRESAK
jgi:hypothetical protein